MKPVKIFTAHYSLMVSVWDSVFDSVYDSVYNSVYRSVWKSVKYSNSDIGESVLVKHRIVCKKHNESILVEKYDAYACLKCNMWLEQKCSDSTCIFCETRPVNPNEIK